MKEINAFELKAIPDLLEKNFFIPDYQRGYRWGELNIHQLLSDIWDFSNNGNPRDFYCLQPIVLKECTKETVEKYQLTSKHDDNKWYEVVDGQQRLTTIRLIIQINNLLQPLSQVSNVFNVFYETRPELKNIFNELKIVLESDGRPSIDIDKSNIDNFYITSGLSHILNWFITKGESHEKRATIHQFPLFFSVFFGRKAELNQPGKSAQILWYCVNEKNDKAKSIFKRLNDNKIPLSNSELIKALFLSDNSFYKPEYEADNKNNYLIDFEKQKKQNHIAKIWEIYEHNLRNKKFWSFITNKKITSFSSAIELLFNYISKKDGNEKTDSNLNRQDPLYTFLYFDEQLRKGEDLWELWLKVEQYYETLVYWFENRELYHKIGYLITVKNDAEIIPLLTDAVSLNKNKFLKLLDEKISQTVDIDFGELNYESRPEPLKNFLILYNIISVYQLENKEYYSFDMHKEKVWSLEHIHAQNSDNLSRDNEKEWRVWLDEHEKTFWNLANADYVEQNVRSQTGRLLKDITDLNRLPKIDFAGFLNIFNKVLKFFENFENVSESYATHSLSNIALLGVMENSILSNSVFETKRKLILQLDAKGIYIPLCTKYIFLKYFNINDSSFENQQVYYWSTKDRNNYLKHILSVMKPYILEKRFLELSKVVDMKNTIIHE